MSTRFGNKVDFVTVRVMLAAVEPEDDGDNVAVDVDIVILE